MISVRKGLAAVAVVAALFSATPVVATVVPPPPPHEGELSQELQREIIRRLGPNMNHQMHRSLSAIAVAGDYRSPMQAGPFNLLIRDQRGWSSWASGKPRTIRRAVGAEIDRLLAGDNFWQEDGFVYGQPCPGVGRVMQVVHRGRDKFSRQPCGPEGLAGRLADLVATGRLPAGPAPFAGGREHMLRGSRGSDYDRALPPPQDPDSAELVMRLKGLSAYALRDGRIDEFLAPYAADVTVAWPDRTERGKKALRRRAASTTWNGLDKRHVTPGEGYLTQTGPSSFTLTGTYHYWDGTREAKMPFTSRWEKRRGIWEITHEGIGAQQPVTVQQATR